MSHLTFYNNLKASLLFLIFLKSWHTLKMSNPEKPSAIGWNPNVISGATACPSDQRLYPCLPSDNESDKSKKVSTGSKHKRSSSSSSTSSSTSSSSSDSDKKDKTQSHALKKKARKEAKLLRKEQKRQNKREKKEYKKAKKLEKKQKKMERKAQEDSLMNEADCGPPICRFFL